MKPTYLEELDRLPPIICWLLARKRRSGAGVPMTKADLAKSLGWSVKRVDRFCALWTWAKVSVQDADAFRRACFIPRHLERKQRAYLKDGLFHRQHGFAHIKSHQKAKLIEELRLAAT